MAFKVFAFCGFEQRYAIRRAAGVIPLTCPPVLATRFTPNIFKQDWDMLYFSLHGMPAEPYWYGDDWQTALSAGHFEGADLSQTVVFVANCYLEGSPMEKAILECRPKALIGGSGQNWTRNKRLVGANLLGWYVRRLVQGGIAPAQALHLAKLGMRGRNSAIKHRVRKRPYDADDLNANLDAMKFKLLVKDGKTCHN